ncbi:hypothetical protein E2C01_057386 [Portunus trituberculatus]|uniref:Uncharacterized protein n=1 Tax=Portunus trituberculatus TaxID=210409 RepID=A0A5B7GTB8_PORTR|nr:hypothetical protein [Portunus trituberculatus]
MSHVITNEAGGVAWEDEGARADCADRCVRGSSGGGDASRGIQRKTCVAECVPDIVQHLMIREATMHVRRILRGCNTAQGEMDSVNSSAKRIPLERKRKEVTIPRYIGKRKRMTSHLPRTTEDVKPWCEPGLSLL